MELKPVTVVIPAVDEPGIDSTVRSLLGQTTPPDRIIVALNNTDDPNATRLPALAVGDPRVEVIDHGTCLGRKAEAINRTLGLLERAGLVLVMDADTALSPRFIETALTELKHQFVGGVGALFHGQPPRSYLQLCQYLEWQRYSEQSNRTKRTFIMSGTAALIRWEALESVRREFGHWYDTGTITEDSRLSIDLKLCGWQLRSPAGCEAVTETMPTVRMLFLQRRRWNLGALQNLWDAGISRTTLPYLGQQVMLAVSVSLMSLLITLTLAAVIMHGLITPEPFWLAVGAVFAVERVVTVWGQSARYRLFAALVLPELLFALILQASYVAAVYQFLTRQQGSWHHLTPTPQEATS